MTAKTLNILFCVQHFIPDGGGAEIVTFRLARSLVERGHRVIVVTGRYGNYAKQESIDGVEVHRLFIGRYIAVLHEILFLMSLAIYLARNLYKADLVQLTQLQLPALVALVFARLLKKKVVVRNSNAGAYGDIAKWDGFPLGRRLLRIIARGVDSSIAVSVETCDELKKAGFSPETMSTIPNGVEIPKSGIQDRPSLRRQLMLEERSFLVIFVGRLSVQKDPGTLLDAWIHLNSHINDTQLVILGEGDLREKLVEKAAWNSLETRVLFEGKVEKVDKYLSAADVFVLPSLSEGMSNALLEAMAASLPVIATRVGGTVDIIRHGENGLLFDVGDTDSLSNYLLELSQSTELRRKLGASARQTIEEQFSLNIITNRYLELYKNLIFN